MLKSQSQVLSLISLCMCLTKGNSTTPLGSLPKLLKRWSPSLAAGGVPGRGSARSLWQGFPSLPQAALEPRHVQQLAHSCSLQHWPPQLEQHAETQACLLGNPDLLHLKLLLPSQYDSFLSWFTKPYRKISSLFVPLSWMMTRKK